MSNIQIGDQTWELHDADGSVVRSAAPMRSGARLSAQWRVFGPWGPETMCDAADVAAVNDPASIHGPIAIPRDPRIEAWVAALSAMPESVTIADIERAGRDVTPTDHAIDLDELFGRPDGLACHQAIAVAELTLDKAGEVALGCGADWWMQGWVDGEAVFDTLATGNNKAVVGPGSHTIHLSLAAGRHLLVARLISGSFGWSFAAALIDPAEAQRRTLVSSPDWRFLTPPGAEGDDAAKIETAVVYAPADTMDPKRAIRTDTAYQDLTAEFAFCWESTWADAGFIFRATDPRHHYLVHFPVVGQHARSEHFWGCVSKVDERGYVEVIHMEMIHGVSSLIGSWHHVKVSVEADTIRVWVDGRPMSAVIDDTYGAPGYVGLWAYESDGGTSRDAASCCFRHLCVTGGAAEAPDYATTPAPVRNWFHVTDVGSCGGCGSIVRAANGDLLAGNWTHRLRSRDSGRTWIVDDDQPPGSGPLWALPDGRLAMFSVASDPPFTITRSVSDDNGRTWSSKPVGRFGFPEHLPWTHCYCCDVLPSRSGALCLAAYTVTGGEGTMVFIDGQTHDRRPPPGSANYCVRSTDDGESWSAPVNLDGGPHGSPGQVAKEGSEISVAQRSDGAILALVRPYRSPVMWETWSRDDGVTWQPLARGPFPMYACTQSMTSTQNGALIVGGRFPGLGVQVSHDGGMTWTGYMIDNACWANGAMFEIEPNVVLFIYGGRMEPRQLRGQLIRITDDGIEPVRR